jgi:glutathione-regulated potassium-efflux system ancillary protein KefF
MIVVVQAHPHPDHSRANHALGRAIEDLDGVERRSLYDLYPDFAIDVAAEQRALGAASAVVWQHPLYWYSAPALLKLWFETVLTDGWAYGAGGVALRDKPCLWAVSTGGEAHDYSGTGMHAHVFDTFAAVIRQTAQFCGMRWLEPLIVHGAHRADGDELAAHGVRYRQRLVELRDAESGHV